MKKNLCIFLSFIILFTSNKTLAMESNSENLNYSTLNMKRARPELEEKMEEPELKRSKTTVLTINDEKDYIYRDDFIEYIDTVEEIIFTKKINNVSARTFKNFTKLKKVTFLAGVDNIHFEAFMNCKKLEEVSFNNLEISSVYDYAFQNCPNLKFFIAKFKANALIGNFAFSDCVNLEEVNFFTNNSSISNFNETVFLNCVKLKNINLNGKLISYMHSKIFTDFKLFLENYFKTPITPISNFYKPILDKTDEILNKEKAKLNVEKLTYSQTFSVIKNWMSSNFFILNIPNAANLPNDNNILFCFNQRSGSFKTYIHITHIMLLHANIKTYITSNLHFITSLSNSSANLYKLMSESNFALQSENKENKIMNDIIKGYLEREGLEKNKFNRNDPENIIYKEIFDLTDSLIKENENFEKKSLTNEEKCSLILEYIRNKYNNKSELPLSCGKLDNLQLSYIMLNCIDISCVIGDHGIIIKLGTSFKYFSKNLKEISDTEINKKIFTKSIFYIKGACLYSDYHRENSNSTINNGLYQSKNLIAYIGDNKELIIPGWIEQITQYFYCYNKEKIEKITFLNNTTSLHIDTNSFSDFTNLKEVIVNRDISAKKSAFSNCNNLNKITLSNNLSDLRILLLLNKSHFKNCDKLKLITLGDKQIPLSSTTCENSYTNEKFLYFLTNKKNIGNLIKLDKDDPWTQENYSEISKKVSEILENQKILLKKESLSEEEKSSAIYTWITENIEYDTTGLATEKETRYSIKANRTSIETFKNKSGVCIGISRLANIMYQYADIPCVTFSSVKHAWNAIKVNGKWRCIDITWDVGKPKNKFEFFNKEITEFSEPPEHQTIRILIEKGETHLEINSNNISDICFKENKNQVDLDFSHPKLLIKCIICNLKCNKDDIIKIPEYTKSLNCKFELKLLSNCKTIEIPEDDEKSVINKYFYKSSEISNIIYREIKTDPLSNNLNFFYRILKFPKIKEEPTKLIDKIRSLCSGKAVEWNPKEKTIEIK